MPATPGPDHGTRIRRLDEGERSALRWLFRFVRPYRARLAGILALSLASTGLGLAQPYITKFLIDDGLLAGRFGVVAGLAGLMLGLAVLASLLGAFNRWHYVDVSARILLALREDVFAHLQRLSPAYHGRARGGDLFARLDGDVAEIQRFAIDSILAFINGVIALLGALALMLSLSWRLSLLALVLLPAVVLFLRLMRPRVERMTRRVRERTSDIASFFFDMLPAIKFIQSIGGEARESARLHDLHEVYRGDLLRLQMTNYAAAAGPGLLLSLSTALAFVGGGYLVVEGAMSLGTLIAFSVYLGRATGPIQTLLGLYVATHRARVSLGRVAAIMAAEPAVASPAAPRAWPAAAGGEIRFEGVGFRYDPGGPDILHHIDMVIPAGRKVGLIGVSGVGKTTLIDLLQRHYDPTAGRILLDGIDLRQLELSALRRRIAVVAQDTTLFSGSLTDNIRYAAPEASEAEVREAARAAEVDAFAAALPRGYDTDIGARGTALSGGQRQRLAIARALLQDPLVLVLDEATSAVDREAEVRIAEALDRLFGDRTRLVITHRPRALEDADVVLELKGGTLVPPRATGAGGR